MACNQRIPLWVLDAIPVKVNIQLGPPNNMAPFHLDGGMLSERCVFEPGKILER